MSESGTSKFYAYGLGRQSAHHNPNPIYGEEDTKLPSTETRSDMSRRDSHYDGQDRASNNDPNYPVRKLGPPHKFENLIQDTTPGGQTEEKAHGALPAYRPMEMSGQNQRGPQFRQQPFIGDSWGQQIGMPPAAFMTNDPDAVSPTSSRNTPGHTGWTMQPNILPGPPDVDHFGRKRGSDSMLSTPGQFQYSNFGSQRRKTVPTDDPGRAKYLEKNRLAASRCRTKQKQKTEELVQLSKNHERRNLYLKTEVEMLKATKAALMELVHQHSECPDDRIQNYVQSIADKLSEEKSSDKSTENVTPADPPSVGIKDDPVDDDQDGEPDQ
ncbi:hypothetical protein GQ43DRAFT_13711 [Delitschia confertaspora ATCC 74209]|uniref:BZIP domain-containing protein n=1 Tax=Delitschia confertaspora ATCC 74209 TaxID=1513339 RepID=A0A9P4JPE2_9PLEO|nr:hypothetical protein GQ43DRAFT_13711 [Delitschia confertaspora ATCC 74209]